VTGSLSRYSTVAVILHWLIAVLILANILIAWKFNTMPQGLAFFQIIQLHKSIGITVLLLSVLRLVWRLVNPPPALPAHMPAWEKFAANAVHWGFYVIMLGMPLSGWAMVSTSKYNLPTLLYGKIPWPHIAPLHNLAQPAKEAVSHWSQTTHGALAWLAYALIVLHVGAALKHIFIDRDDVVARMIPFLRKKA
jgi:cytochrome b561